MFSTFVDLSYVGLEKNFCAKDKVFVIPGAWWTCSESKSKAGIIKQYLSVLKREERLPNPVTGVFDCLSRSHD